jgi:hypothetical protein
MIHPEWEGLQSRCAAAKLLRRYGAAMLESRHKNGPRHRRRLIEAHLNGSD